MPRQEREQLILEVAGQVFARGGYHSGSMDEIAELADVSKPMLYAYFGSKEGLYLAYIDRTGRELLERLVAAAAREHDPAVRVRARIAEFLAFVEEHRDGWRVLFREMTSTAPLAEEVAGLRGQITEVVRRMVEGAVPPQSSLAPPASEAVAHAIVGAGESIANWWLEHPEVARQEVARWYAEVVQAAFTAAVRRSPVARRG
jgi:AcrR family transcriptional regulator